MERKEPCIPVPPINGGIALSRRRLIQLTAASTLSLAIGQAHVFATQSTPNASPISTQAPTMIVPGLTPGERVSIASRSQYGLQIMGAEALYEVDRWGNIDCARNRPVSGDFDVADPMAFIWAAAGPSRVVKQDESDSALVIAVYRDDKEIARLATERRFLPDFYRPDYIYTDDRVGYLYPRADGIDAPAPAIIVLGGSESDVPNFDFTSALLATHGYVVLRLAYFRAGSLPQSLERIPLEYFGDAIVWLRDEPMVQSDKIGVFGYSRGGELALLLGSVYPELSSVVSGSGSGVVSSGLGRNYAPSTASAWTLKGEEIPYANWTSGDLMPPDETIIPVEQANGPVLLVSGDGDELWPSTELSRIAWERLESAERSFADQFLSYPGAGHLISPPYFPPPVSCSGPLLLENPQDKSLGEELLLVISTLRSTPGAQSCSTWPRAGFL